MDHTTVALLSIAVVSLLFGWSSDRMAGTTQDGIRIYAVIDCHQGFMAIQVYSLTGLAAVFNIMEAYFPNRCA